ncbi:SDR family NAD(P)-dependent oxidoreductase [Actinomadura flavalba]|uniref:SDR family NAD(P)-dependent oxidoreductase n=1 Tax=Actinomadura flavalba TaxID=1120938 RepID=UPI000361B04E|nr:SDR family oxidoreductase [Actinomadura flavalba]
MAEHTYVVAGGAGIVGACVVTSLLARGATVYVPSRSPERLAALRESVPAPHRARLRAVRADVGDPAGAARFRDLVAAEAGAPDGVVAALGRWWEGLPLTEVPLDTWTRVLRDNLTSHFVAAQAFVPLLADRPGGVYVSLNGIAALKPVPLSGPVSATDAAQHMLMRTFAAENPAVRMHEILVLTPVVTPAWPADDPVDARWLSGETVGAYVADVVTGPGDGTPFDLRLPHDWDVWS